MAKLTDDMLRFIIDLDASGAQGKINTLTADISKLERENQSLRSILSQNEKEMQQLATQMERLEQRSMSNTKKMPLNAVFIGIAEGGGFEPPVPLRVRQFSKLVVSATHPSFLSGVLPNCFFSKAGAKVMQIFHMRKNKLKNLVYFNKMRANHIGLTSLTGIYES